MARLAVAKYNRCPFPECERHPLPGKSPHGFCTKHEEFIRDIIFAFNRVLVQEPKTKETKGGIVLPGQPGFGFPLKKGVNGQ